jgi:hypothetical protein
MKAALLRDGRPDAIRVYVDKKFKRFAHWSYPNAVRTQKCINYWIAADGNRGGQRIIEDAYQRFFKQLFPLEKAEAELERRHKSPLKFESGDWYEGQQVRLARMEQTLVLLNEWKDGGDYQEGDKFFNQLKSATRYVADDLCDDVQFAKTFESSWVQQLTTHNDVGQGRIKNVGFDAMLGFKQTARLSFSAYSMKWGEINALLEQSLQAGVWGRGQAQAEMTRLGFKADVQAAIAMGGQFDLAGQCTWRKGKVGLNLEGSCEVFVGARGNVSAGLSASVKGRLHAAFQAEAFVGFSASVKGSCAFTYDDKELVGITASAGVSFGAGGSCKFEIDADLFGPTTIQFGVNVALGLGTSTEAAVAINFTEIYLAGATEFQKVIYLPTLARGYKMDLMNEELRNRVYLDKCIARFGDEIEGLNDTLDKFDRVPMEKRSLLMG